MAGKEPDTKDARAFNAWQERKVNLLREYCSQHNDYAFGSAWGVVMAAEALDEHGSKCRKGARDQQRMTRVATASYPHMERAFELLDVANAFFAALCADFAAAWRADPLASISRIGHVQLAVVDRAMRDPDAALARLAAFERKDADAAAALAKKQHEESELLREAARGTDEILAGLLAAVAPKGLSIKEGRLVVERDGQQEFFADLSEGERWALAMDLALAALGEACVVVDTLKPA